MTTTAPFRTTVAVTGMTCEHCVRAVTAELSAVAGVRNIDVALSEGMVTIDSDRELSGTEIAAAVDEAGYELAD